MQDYLPMLAKLPIVVAALGWAVRELIVLHREEKADQRGDVTGDRGSA